MTDFSFNIFNTTWKVLFIDNFNDETKEWDFKFVDTNY